ncbi:MAG: CoA pyrophosphatase [Candidatus Bathyarchaeota archaeon]|nr:MAG: CoA pyrophosphatase [Candidatus Bathyarchaeota archaeon]
MKQHQEIIENLSPLLRSVSEIQNADAAVALLLKPASEGFKTLFVRRVENPLDPWSGQIAFPGGKRSLTDQNIKQTVIRETLEETNINLVHGCRFLGMLDTMKSTLRPELLVAPFIILLEREPSIILNNELKGYSWVSIKRLQKCKGTAKFPFGEVNAYLFDGKVIWGLTYRICEKFLPILEHAFSQRS